MESMNHKILQTAGKVVFLSFGAFFSGFVFYYLAYRKKMLGFTENQKTNSDKQKNLNKNIKPNSKKIPLETLERIMKKIKNKIIILLANLYDKTVLMNIVREQKKEQTLDKEKDIIVETISSGEIARSDDSQEQKSSLNLSSKKNIQKLHQLKTFFNCKYNILFSEANLGFYNQARS